MTDELWQCWKIIGCNKQDQCPAGQQEGKECWEIAQEMDDYRTALKICEDCLVYLSKGKSDVLTPEEIEIIMEKKGVCVLASKCLEEV